jgi:hypothetical protein
MEFGEALVTPVHLGEHARAVRPDEETGGDHTIPATSCPLASDILLIVPFTEAPLGRLEYTPRCT